MTTQNKTNTKITLILIYSVLFMLFIIARLFYLQIVQSQELFHLGTRNYTRVSSIASLRGDILDSNGFLLATNRPIFNLYWYGLGQRKLSEDQQKNIESLKEILPEIITDSLIDNIKSAEHNSKKLLIFADLDLDQISKLEEIFSSNDNIKIEKDFKRFYPYQTLASHIIGYLSQANIEAIGKMGLEHILETELKGQKGKMVSTINALGKKLSQEEISDAISGQTIKTTLDIRLQQILELSFPEEYSGSIIIMDPYDGSIKSLLSRPAFNPNIFLKSINHDEWQELQKERPFINRALNASYPPASIFKLVTITAGLEEKIIEEHTESFCRGYTIFAGRNYHCANKTGHGQLNIKDAFAKSCNIVFYAIGKRLKIDTLAKYAYQFGLGKKTGIIFQEKDGLIPTNLWKIQRFGQRWWPGETLSAAIGQSYLLVTPIQIAKMISSIFTGYQVKPRILQAEPIETAELQVKKDTLQFLQSLMKKVVKSGTGQRVNQIHDITIYAKTGTAQTSSLEKRELGKEFLEHAWFVSYFYYKDHKPLTMVIMIEHSGTTRLAVNTAKSILLKYRRMMEN